VGIVRGRGCFCTSRRCIWFIARVWPDADTNSLAAKYRMKNQKPSRAASRQVARHAQHAQRRVLVVVALTAAGVLLVDAAEDGHVQNSTVFCCTAMRMALRSEHGDFDPQHTIHEKSTRPCPTLSAYLVRVLRLYVYEFEHTYVCVCEHTNTPLGLCGWVCVCHEASVLQCVAVCYSVLQCVAVCCSVL